MQDRAHVDISATQLREPASAMTQSDRNIILCSCEDTMALDPAKIGAGCKGQRLTTARHLCGPEIGKFRDLARDGVGYAVRRRG